MTPLLFAETPLEDSFPGPSEYIVPRKFLTPPLLTSFHFTGKKKKNEKKSEGALRDVEELDLKHENFCPLHEQ